ncbi:hypothetical protein ACVGVP_15950 [Pseudonocardia artemisiae]
MPKVDVSDDDLARSVKLTAACSLLLCSCRRSCGGLSVEPDVTG